MRSQIVALLAFAALTACGGGGVGSSSSVAVDPSPNAAPVEAITEPSDGSQNEISVE